MSSRHLILIRHSQSRPVEGVAPHTWALTEIGRERCTAVAAHLRPYRLDKLYCSYERKAVQTAQLVAEQLMVPVEIVANVHEHVRADAPFLPPNEFKTTLESFFRKPQELVFGSETAEQALNRFADAIDNLIARDTQEIIAVVTHGTVLSLFVSAYSIWEPIEFWKRLGQPAIAMLHIPSFALARTSFTV